MLWGEYNYDEDIAAQRQEAFDDGISQGISQGIQQKAIETAKNMFAKNIPLKIIAECTGLPLETIENLTKELLVKN
jgi:predicted transposase/invertase (TIGR01784 family)